MLKEGTIVDANIMEAPSSTKNRKRERDPEMKQTRKGNQRHLGMKLHVGVDDGSSLVHSLATTSAKVHGLRASEELLAPGRGSPCLGKRCRLSWNGEA